MNVIKDSGFFLPSLYYLWSLRFSSGWKQDGCSISRTKLQHKNMNISTDSEFDDILNPESLELALDQ